MSDDTPLKHLYFYHYRINLCARESIALPPYKGNVFRGVFGYTLKNIVCKARHTECDVCQSRLQCVYSLIMGAPVSGDHVHAAKYRNPPRPYIIVPPLTRKKQFSPDETFTFDITLVGICNACLPYFIYAFIEMGNNGLGKSRGRFEVVNVEAMDIDGNVQEVFHSHTGIVKNTNLKIGYEDCKTAMHNASADKITLFFETQVRIKQQDVLAQDLAFSLLVERLSERAFLLAHFYCGAELGGYEDFAKDSGEVTILENTLAWHDWKRYSGRHKYEMTWGGWKNAVTYKGNFRKYLPLLKMGEHIHVGKAATFGLGKYRIVKNIDHVGQGL